MDAERQEWDAALQEFAATVLRGSRHAAATPVVAAADASTAQRSMCTAEASRQEEDAESKVTSPKQEVPVVHKAGLYVGSFALIKGILTKPELNDQKVSIREYCSTRGRWRVTFGNRSEKWLLAENIEPILAVEPPSSPLASASEENHPDAAEVAEKDLSRVRQGAEELGAVLARRREALRRAALGTVQGQEGVARLRAELEAVVSDSQPRLEEYMTLNPPATLEELRQRNQTRRQLQELAQTVQHALEGIAGAFEEPTEVLGTAEHSILQRLDSLQLCLQQLRQDTVERFKLQNDKVHAAKEQRDAIWATVSSHVRPVDAFLRCLAKELKAESDARRESNARRMDKLREEEARFVRANQSPSQNASFKMVRSELEAMAAAERVDAERAEREAALLRGWEELLGKLPCQLGAAEPSGSWPQEAAPSGAPRAEAPAEDAAAQAAAVRRPSLMRAFWRLW